MAVEHGKILQFRPRSLSTPLRPENESLVPDFSPEYGLLDQHLELLGVPDLLQTANETLNRNLGYSVVDSGDGVKVVHYTPIKTNEGYSLRKGLGTKAGAGGWNNVKIDPFARGPWQQSMPGEFILTPEAAASRMTEKDICTLRITVSGSIQSGTIQVVTQLTAAIDIAGENHYFYRVTIPDASNLEKELMRQVTPLDQAEHGGYHSPGVLATFFIYKAGNHFSPFVGGDDTTTTRQNSVNGSGIFQPTG